ncbi:hypothetical protein ACJX0J_033649, partial [Zea mays]
DPARRRNSRGNTMTLPSHRRESDLEINGASQDTVGAKKTACKTTQRQILRSEIVSTFLLK